MQICVIPCDLPKMVPPNQLPLMLLKVSNSLKGRGSGFEDGRRTNTTATAMVDGCMQYSRWFVLPLAEGTHSQTKIRPEGTLPRVNGMCPQGGFASNQGWY